VLKVLKKSTNEPLFEGLKRAAAGKEGNSKIIFTLKVPMAQSPLLREELAATKNPRLAIGK
jgi:hypothetical protein